MNTFFCWKKRVAVQAIFERAVTAFGDAPAHLSQEVQGGRDVGAALVADPRIRLISATGSTEMGRKVGQVVAGRFAKTILELGGNNAMIVAPSADMDMAVRGVVFSAVGTAGQRCTSLRRLIAHRSIKDDLVTPLAKACASLPIGDPRAAGTNNLIRNGAALVRHAGDVLEVLSSLRLLRVSAPAADLYDAAQGGGAPIPPSELARVREALSPPAMPLDEIARAAGRPRRGDPDGAGTRRGGRHLLGRNGAPGGLIPVPNCPEMAGIVPCLTAPRRVLAPKSPGFGRLCCGLTAL